MLRQALLLQLQLSRKEIKLYCAVSSFLFSLMSPFCNRLQLGVTNKQLGASVCHSLTLGAKGEEFSSSQKGLWHLGCPPSVERPERYNSATCVSIFVSCGENQETFPDRNLIFWTPRGCLGDVASMAHPKLCPKTRRRSNAVSSTCYQITIASMKKTTVTE